MKNIDNSQNNFDNTKPTIESIVVVEGKSDTNKLKRLFNLTTIETNGLNLTTKTINLIKASANNKPVILFLDPDGPGEKIRKKLVDELNETINIFIQKKDIDLSKGKIGVAEAYDQAIINAFKHLVTFNKNNSSLTWSEYLDLGLDSKIKRKQVTDYYHISECNNKQLFKRLNMMNVTFKEIKGIIK